MKALARPKAILFDWDNTLVNTWPVIHEALHKTFTQMGREPWTLDIVKKRVSRSMRDAFPDIFGDDWERAADIYQSQFRAIHLQRIEELPGAEANLAYLKDKPVYVAVVSNKKGVNLRAEVEHLGWKQYFTKVVGAHDTSRDKPFPDPVHASLDGSKIKPGPDIWFVGDSVVDMECAHVTGCIPVWFGEIPPEPMQHEFHAQVTGHKELSAMLRQAFG